MERSAQVVALEAAVSERAEEAQAEASAAQVGRGSGRGTISFHVCRRPGQEKTAFAKMILVAQYSAFRLFRLDLSTGRGRASTQVF